MFSSFSWYIGTNLKDFDKVVILCWPIEINTYSLSAVVPVGTFPAEGAGIVRASILASFISCIKGSFHGWCSHFGTILFVLCITLKRGYMGSQIWWKSQGGWYGSLIRGWILSSHGSIREFITSFLLRINIFCLSLVFEVFADFCRASNVP